MTRGVLRNASGRLRSGWRIALWLAAVFSTYVAIHVAVRAAGVEVGGGLGPWAALTVLALAAVSLGAWRFLDGRPPGLTPLAPKADARRLFAVGLLVGLAVTLFVVGVLALTGAYRVETRSCEAAQQAAFLGRWLTIFLLAAAVEELLFRGYFLFTLREGAGTPVAVVVTAALFALAHAGNPHFGWTAGLSIAFIGVFLGAWALATNTLWGVLGAHLGWNWALAAVAAIPVSGLTFRAPCYVGVLEGPAWLTGGAFGVEAGALAVAGWGLAGAGFWARRRTRRG